MDVALLAAYLPEYQNNVDLLEGKHVSYNFSGRFYTTGRIGDKKVVVTMTGIDRDNKIVITMTGIGMTNAAMTTQAVILLFNPTYILQSGIAGSMSPSMRIGDVATYVDPDMKKMIRPFFGADGKETSAFLDMATDFPDKLHGSCMVAAWKLCGSCTDGKETSTFLDMATDLSDKFYDGNTSASNYTVLYPTSETGLVAPAAADIGAVPSTATFSTSGFMVPMEVEVLMYKEDTFETPTPPTMFHLPASPVILEVAAKVLPTVTLFKAIPGSDAPPLPYQPVAELVEVGMASNTFVDNADYRKQMHALYNVSIVEMEGHAVLHVCLSSKVHCAIIRSVSDLAGGEPGQMGESEIGTFFGIAALNTALVSKAIIMALPRTPNFDIRD
ncbi:hypothetical protein FOA52_013952 [Chlamydomonas sp. UWO 241]|nr:hypothetical protein FOA52_013952 [Chlamydomonas sp. UWO 241]